MHTNCSVTADLEKGKSEEIIESRVGLCLLCPNIVGAANAFRVFRSIPTMRIYIILGASKLLKMLF